jgi:hypothetical protein
MSRDIWFGAQAFFWVLYGFFGYQLGLFNQLFVTPGTPAEPSSGGFWDQVIAPFTYMWQNVEAFFQFLTFQPVGVDPVISTPVVAFFVVIDVLLIYRMIRGN